MTRLFARGLTLTGLVGALTLMPAAQADAAFMAYICSTADCSAGGDLSVTDDAAGDALGAMPGIITMMTMNFNGYEVAINTSQSKPLLASGMDLAYVVTNATNGVLGPIWLYAVDTNFMDGPLNIGGQLGGTQPGGTTTTAIICDGDASTADFSPCSSASNSASGAFTIGMTHNVTASPYALTIGVKIDTLANGQTATGDFRVVPEPASMALLGLGLFGLAAFQRRRRP